MTTISVPVLDRRERFDKASLGYPMRATLPPRAPRSYTWRCPIHLNQNIGCYHCDHYGGCVGHGLLHALAARPTSLPTAGLNLRREPWDLYHGGQRLDPPEWNTPPEEGTSVLAGLQEARARGLIAGFTWGFSIIDWVLGVGLKGTGLVGSTWRTGMWEPDSDGFLHATGADEGGHAYALNRVQLVWQPGTLYHQKRADGWYNYLDPRKTFFQVWQSWDLDWGQGGTAKLSLLDADVLRRDHGEIAFVERVRP